jgi:hypothetical protein
MNPTTLPKIRVVLAGPVGEEPVLKNLLGENINVGRMKLNGFEVVKQTKPPEGVWNDLKQYWDEADPPVIYKGAYSLNPNEGAAADVGYVEFDSPVELKPAARILGAWSEHDSRPVSRRTEGRPWFQYKELFRDGDTSYVSEVLAPETNKDTEIKRVPDNYRDDPEYKEFAKVMTEQSVGFAKLLEGPSEGSGEMNKA